MTTLSIILILISFFGGIAAIISLAISLIRKNKKHRKHSVHSLLGMAAVFVVGIVIFVVAGDLTAPEITASEATFEYGQSISVNDIASATDNKDDAVTLTISSVESEQGEETAVVAEDFSSVVFAVPGDYTVTVCAVDESGNEATADSVVHIEDNTPPAFTAFADQVEVEYGKSIKIADQKDEVNEIYAVAEDEITGVDFFITDVQPVSDDLTDESYTLTAEAVCFLDVGDFLVTVTAEDAYGNSISDTVQVTAIDKVAPEFSGLKSNYTLADDESAPDYLDGVSAVDEIDGDVTERIALDAVNVSYGVPGEYTVTYSVADDAGNIAEKTVSVIVKDTTPPTITLSQSSFTLTAGDSAPDYSSVVSVTDSVDGNLTEKVEIDDSAVDYSTPGTYEITYTGSDSSGNAVSKTATVTVKSKVTASTQTSSSSSSGGETVYITKTGTKYHRGSCRYLSQSKIAISKSEAIAQGYEACKVCNP